MIRTVLSSVAVVALLAGAAVAQDAGEARVRRILERTPLIDGHNDLPWEIRTRVAGKVEALASSTAADAQRK